MKNFGATLVLHINYNSEESASVAGHRLNGFATVQAKAHEYFKSKEAFMGMICTAFERFYDEMKNDRKDQNIHNQTPQ